MRLGKKTSRAISIALLAAMASTSLPQVDVLAAVKNGMFLSVSYTDKDGNNNKEGTENTVPNESEQSEGAEPVQNEETGAASNVVFRKILKNKHQITQVVHHKIILPTQILPEKLHIIMVILHTIAIMTVQKLL